MSFCSVAMANLTNGELLDASIRNPEQQTNDFPCFYGDYEVRSAVRCTVVLCECMYQGVIRKTKAFVCSQVRTKIENLHMICPFSQQTLTCGELLDVQI